MITPEIQSLLNKADDSHGAARAVLDKGFIGFSAAQSYYTMFYLVEALLLSKGFSFSSHSAIIAAYDKEFAKIGLLDPKFHRNLIVAQKRRETGHYGAESEITNEQALESYQWAEGFMQAVKAYLHKD